MKNFNNYTPEKYSAPEYLKIADGIYKTKDPYGSDDEQVYVTSLSFEQEPDQYGEEDSCPQRISQVPLEDLLDEFGVYITDFYEELNADSERICYQEFGSDDLDDIRNLREMIGKRIYAAPFEEDGEECYTAVIE